MLASLLLVLSTRAPAIGDAMAPFTLRTAQEQPFEWQPGRVTVLTFCAFWCDTWKQQLPRVEESQKATKGLPIDYLTISVDGRWTDRAKDVAVGQMLSDNGGAWSHGIGIDRVPYALVVDPRGKVRWSSYGTIRSEDLTHALRSALSAGGEGGTIYLTFDDFPSERLSLELLDELRREEVPATMFCIGVDVSKHPDLVHSAIDRGNEVEIHSWSHDAADPQIDRCRTTLEGLGAKPLYYRPPGSEKVLDLEGHVLSAPVVDPYDYQRPGPTELLRRILSQVRDGSIIQLHAGVSDTLAALPSLVKNLRERGFRFALLGSAGLPTRSH